MRVCGVSIGERMLESSTCRVRGVVMVVGEGESKIG